MNRFLFVFNLTTIFKIKGGKKKNDRGLNSEIFKLMKVHTHSTRNLYIDQS